jgi:uncharacterized membrane protein YjgN (DUF898 family)
VPTEPIYRGDLGDLYLLALKNVALAIVTLGFYRFWGTTNVRRYLWSHTVIDDEPLEYTGTGGELLVGFLKAMVLVIPFFAVVGVLSWVLRENPRAQPIITAVIYLPLLFLVYYAGFTARRYRLSRTVWRGIRLGQHGSPMTYALLCLKNTFLSVITLGLYFPYANLRQHAYIWNRTQLGNRDFELEVAGGDLMKRYIIAWLLMPLTLGLSMLWYAMAELRYVTSRLKLGKLRFEVTITGGALLGFMIVNGLILVFTMGLGQPIITHRMMRFLCSRVRIHGREDWSQFGRGTSPVPGSGEGMLDLLGADIAS